MADYHFATTRQLLEEIAARGRPTAAEGYYETEGHDMAIGAAALLDSLPGSILDWRGVQPNG